jgi:hypothetical protein
MSQTGQLRQYAEERDPPRRMASSPWKFSPPVQASEYRQRDPMPMAVLRIAQQTSEPNQTSRYRYQGDFIRPLRR